MAFVAIAEPAAVIRLHTLANGNKKYKIRWNEKTHYMMHRPTDISVLYDAATNRLALRAGAPGMVRYAVSVDPDECSYQVYAAEVYTVTGLALGSDTDYTPQYFSYVPGQPVDPEPAALANAIWIQL